MMTSLFDYEYDNSATFMLRRTPRRKLVFSSSDDEIDETPVVHVLRQEHQQQQQQHVDEQLHIRSSTTDLTLTTTSSCTTTRITRSKLEHFGFNPLARPAILRASTGTLKRRSSKTNINQNKKLRAAEPSIETNKPPVASCHPMQTRSQSSSDSHSDHLVKLFDKTLSTVTPIRDSTNTNECETTTTTTTSRRRQRSRPLGLCLSDTTNDMPILEENPHPKRSLDDEEENSEQYRSFKRNKVIDENNNKENVFFNRRTRRTNFVRSFTNSYPANEEQIKASVELGSNRDLIGDRSRTYLLPRCKSRKHADLACINAETMIDLLRDVYAADVENVHIIDCRYPYEYDGGHIKSAKNLYTRAQIFQEYFRHPIPINNNDHSKRTIFVFHCEFSSERAPALLRYFRTEDRNFHQASYPNLYYPEIYLLDGGYKTFFEYAKEFCIPDRYRTMIDVDYQDQCRLYRSISKQSKKFNEQTMNNDQSLSTRTSLTFRSYLSFHQ